MEAKPDDVKLDIQLAEVKDEKGNFIDKPDKKENNKD